MAVTDLGAPSFAMHPLHGVHEPTDCTPARRPGSVRRTTSMDITRTPGAADPVYLAGTGRDLVTAADGGARVQRTVGLRATVAMMSQTVRRLETDPSSAALSELAGAPAMGGFRAAVDARAPELRSNRDVLYSLLDDVPVCTLISGHALGASGQLEAVRTGYLPQADQCAGFVTGGLLMESFAAGDPVIVTGPEAPDLSDSADPLAWHELGDLPLHGMRRRRRVDVVERAGAATVDIDAMFRDTYVRGDGVETIIHEYTLLATVERSTGLILESHATPRVLPWQECPGAVGSAGRVAGMTLSELHFRVRRELSGTSSCTHLNDLLRSVADAEALIALLPAG